MPCGVVPFPFGDCRVCADKATGVHYGVATCEGCKGFYKRSIPKAGNYKCFFGGSCVLSKQNRNRCKACRYKRCVEVGMSTNAVKMGRIPKVDKERALLQVKQKQQSSSQGEVTASQTILQPHPPLDGSISQLQSMTSFPEMLKPLSTPSSAHFEYSGHQLLSQPETRHHQDNAEMNCGVAAAVSDGMGMVQDVLNSRITLDSECNLEARPLGYMNKPTMQSAPPGHQHYTALEVPKGATSNDRWEPSEQPISGGLQSSRSSQSCSPALSATCDQRPRSASSTSSGTRGIFSPVIIKELLTQVIESGNEASLRETLKNQLLSPELEGSYQSDVQPSVQSHDVSTDLSWHETKSAVEKFNFGAESLGVGRPGEIKGICNPAKTDQLLALVSANSQVNESTSAMGINLRGSMEQYDRNEKPLTDWADHKPMSSVGLNVQDRMTPFSGQSEDNLQRYAKVNCATSPTYQESYPNGATCQKENYLSVGSATDLFAEGILQQVVEPLSANLSCGSTSPMTDANVGQVSHPSDQSLMRSKYFNTSMSFLGESEVSSTQEQLIFNGKHNVNGIEVPDSSVSTGDSSSAKYHDMELDPTYVEKIKEKFSFVYNDVHRSIRLQEKYMRLELDGKLPIHPLNKVTKPTKGQLQYVWQLLKDSVPECNKIILDFCRSLPHFPTVNNADQAILLQEAYFDIWLICHSKLFHDGETYLRFKCNMRYSRFWMSYILPDSLIIDIHKFTTELNRYKLKDIEIIMLCALQLINPEREGLSNVELVHHLHGHYFNLLIHLTEKLHRGNHGHILVGLIRLLPSLNSLNKQTKAIIDNFSIDDMPEYKLSQYVENEEREWSMAMDLSAYEKMDVGALE